MTPNTIQLTNGRTVTITRPTGAKLVAAQVWFGAKFARLRDHPPTSEAAQRRAFARIAKHFVPHVRGATADELLSAFLVAPYDMGRVAGAVLAHSRVCDD